MNSVFLKKYRFHIVLFLISILNFIFMLFFSAEKSLWYDDIYQLYFSWNRKFTDMIDSILYIDLNPPLWAIISFIWLKIAPYGTLWLRIPSMLFVASSAFISGLTAKELSGAKAGFLSTLLFSLSPYITIECGYSFRSYGLYIFASAFLIYAYVRKLRTPSKFNRIIFALGVFIVAFTHYFGAILCVFLGISDLLLFIKKKQSISFFIEYLCVAFLELFWVIPQASTITSALSDFWPPRPSALSYLNLFKSLLLDSYIIALFFLVILIIYLISTMKAVRDKTSHMPLEKVGYCKLIFAVIPIIFVLVIVIYCNIRPQSSVWVYRYFVCLYPMLIIFFATSLSDLFEKFKESKTSLTTLSFMLLLILLSNYTIKVAIISNTEYEPFEEVAEIIISEEEIKNGNQVLVYCTVNCGQGWKYYLSKNNTIDISNINLTDNLDYVKDKYALFELFKSYDVIYFYAEHIATLYDEKLYREIKNVLALSHKEIVIDEYRSVYKYVKI